MKKIAALLMMVAIVAMGADLSWANSQNFAVSATVPLASGVTFTVTEIQANGTWTQNHPNDLDFGTLDYDPENKIFRPTKYFAIDIGVIENGAGQPDNISFAYTEGANPNQAALNDRGGLGKKATVDVVKSTVENIDTAVKDKVLISQVASLGTIGKASFTNGWPRVYVGMYDGSSTALNEAGWEVFTVLDAPGNYIGTLQITATVN